MRQQSAGFSKNAKSIGTRATRQFGRYLWCYAIVLMLPYYASASEIIRYCEDPLLGNIPCPPDGDSSRTYTNPLTSLGYVHSLEYFMGHSIVEPRSNNINNKK